MGRISEGKSGAGGGRLFNEAGKVNPGMEDMLVQTIPQPKVPTPAPIPQQTRDVNTLVNGALGTQASPQIRSAAAKVPAPAPAPAQPHGIADTLREAFGGLGQKVLGVKKQIEHPTTPQDFIGSIASAAKLGVETFVPAARPVIRGVEDAAGSPAAKGVAKGLGTLAVGMLAAINDPMNYNKAGAENEADLAKQYGTKQGKNLTAEKPVSFEDHAKDVGNDIATALIGRLTVFTKGAMGLAAVPKTAVKLAQGSGLAIFGMQIIKDTPQYVQQIVQTPDPTEKFNLATQLLGSYFLFGHGAKTAAGEIPQTKNVKGATERVPLDFNAAVEFTRSPNPDLSKPQIDAFTELYKQGGSAVKNAVKDGGYDLKTADVTVPTVYGTLINYVRAKIGRGEPLTPSEMKVQAAVATQPETLIPRAEMLVKDPAALEVLRQPADTPAAPPIRTLAQVNLPETNIKTAPQEVAAPAPAPTAPARPQPLGGIARVEDLTQQAIQAATPDEFIQSAAQASPASLRGFTLSDGGIVDGPGTQPGTFAVADVKAKQVVDRPAPEVLSDFYAQARGEAAAPSPLERTAERTAKGTEKNLGTPGRDTNVPTKKSLKKLIRTKSEAQAAVDVAQHEANATPKKSLKTAKLAPHDRLARDRADELRQLDQELGGVTRVPGVNGKQIRASTNSKFYRETYKATGKPPTKADYLAEANRELAAGTDERSLQYQKTAPKPDTSAQEAAKEMIAGIKFKTKPIEAGNGGLIYHATPAKFEKFDTSKTEGGVVWFTNDKTEITNNAVGAVNPDNLPLNIMVREIKAGIKLADEALDEKLTTDQLIAAGYRGVVYDGENGVQWTRLFFPNEDTVIPSKAKLSSAETSQQRTVKQGASYLMRSRGELPFEFTNKPLASGAAATFERISRMVKAEAGIDAAGKSVVNIQHVGHEVGHELFAEILTPAERTEFAGIIRAEFKGDPKELTDKIVSYNYTDLSEAHQGALDFALAELRKNEPSLLPAGSAKQPGYAQMRAAYRSYAAKVDELGQDVVDRAIKQSAPGSGRGLVKFLQEAHDQSTTKTYSDTVMEEIFADLNGEYVAGRTGKWSDQLKLWFSDLWNAIKKAVGANYDKMQEVFRKSYEGLYRSDLVPTSSKPFEVTTTKLKVSPEEEQRALDNFAAEAAKIEKDLVAAKKTPAEPKPKAESTEPPKPRLTVEQQMEEGRQKFTTSPEKREAEALWEARLAAAGEAADPLPPALESIKVGDLRDLFDQDSTVQQDYAAIATANKPETAKAAVENYDGLGELRRLKNEERIRTIFKGIKKDKDEELFAAAMDYQIDGKTALPQELQVVFNKVTKLFDSVGQDALAANRIRGLKENYITQIWDLPANPDTSLTPNQIAFLKGASATSTRFSIERVVKNYKQGIEIGLKPKYEKLSDVLREYLAADTRAAAGQYLADDILRLGDEHVLAGANGLPLGWRPVTKLSNLKGYFVAPDVWKAIKPLDTVSGIRSNKVGRTALKINELTKQITLAGDFFLLKNYLFDSFQASALGPLRLLHEANNVSPEARANLVALGGLKLSKINPEQPTKLFGKVGRAFLSSKNPYFMPDHLTFALGDRLRLGTASMLGKKLIKQGVPEMEAARRAVRFAEDTFGRQNMVRAGHSQTTQDVLRLAMIAPDYTLARFRTMGKAAKGAIPGLSNKENRAYTYGFLRKMLIAGFAFEMANLAFSGHTSDKNDEDHKFDLEMHRPDGSKYYVNALGVLKTDLRFIQGLADLAHGDTTTLTRFIGNKGSTLERVAQALITGKDYKGDDIANKYTDSAAEKVQKMAINIANNFVPLPVQGLTSPNTRGEGPAPRGLEGFVYRTLGFDVYDPKRMPTSVRAGLQELEEEKQNTILEVYSRVKSGKPGDLTAAAKAIDDFNAKADATGEKFAKLNNLSDVDKKSLQELGASAAIDKDKTLLKAGASAANGAKPNPISSLIDYGVGGTTIATNKSTTGKQTAHENAVKAAETRKAKSLKKPRKQKKVATSKARKPKRLSLKTRSPRKLALGKKIKGAKVRKIRSPKRIV